MTRTVGRIQRSDSINVDFGDVTTSPEQKAAARLVVADLAPCAGCDHRETGDLLEMLGLIDDRGRAL